jgi:CheY-like chemotaxis protein
MDLPGYRLLLADDDQDDCMFFRDALEELPVSANLTTVCDGVELMALLWEVKTDFPDVLFLDLNMPRKSGFECLSEISKMEHLSKLPIVVFSTSLDMQHLDTLYNQGAHYYIQKPGDFAHLKKVIHETILSTANNRGSKPERKHFLREP